MQTGKIITKIQFTSLLTLVALMSFFAGCKKDPGAALPAKVTISNVKSMITNSATGEPDTVVYTYDNLGRQTTALTDTLLTTYTYSGDTVIMHYLLAGEQFTTFYTLSASGQAVSDSKGNSYAYNSSGYLTRQSYAYGAGYDSISYLYMLSGLNDSISIQHQQDAATHNLVTIRYTYLPTIDSRNFGLTFLGKQNTNLINTETDSQVLNGSTYSITYTYSYTFDSQGRVTQQVQTSGTSTYTTAYTYY
jgi:hypothetical protein